MSEADGKVTKRRRKTVKSCLFCRKRRLKCDHKRPRCSTCEARGLPECTYIEKLTNVVDPGVFLESTPNVGLVRKIKELEKQLEAYTHTTGKLEKNPICDLYSFSQKSGNQFIYHGPTSFRAVMSDGNKKFNDYYRQTLDKLQKDRANLKNMRHHSAVTEAAKAKDDCTDEASILKSICHVLPSYEDICSSLSEFFKGALFCSYRILDSHKVFHDLNMCFFKGPTDPVTNKSPIVGLVPADKDNYYSVGVIIEILCLVYYVDDIPTEIDNFNKHLTSGIIDGTLFIEKMQFLMLQYMYRNLVGLNGDDMTYGMFLVHLASAMATRMGLHQNIRDLYKDKENLCGDIASLETLWYFILLSDLEVSFTMGTPLRISDNHFYQHSSDQLAVSRITLLVKFITLGRNVLRIIHHHEMKPDLKKLIGSLRDFLKENFKPLSYYLNPDNLDGSELGELHILFLTLAMMFNLADLQRVCFKEKSAEIINSCVQYSFISLLLATNIIKKYFMLDCIYSAETMASKPGGLTPYLSFAVFLTYNVMIRIISEGCSLFLVGVAFVEQRALSDTYSKEYFAEFEVFDLSLDSLEIAEDHYVSVHIVIDKLNSIFDQLFKTEDKQILHIFANVYPFVVLFSLQKLSREVLKSALESRALVEARWQTSAHRATIDVGAGTPALERLHLAGLSDEELRMMAQEFWSDFDTGFCEYTQTDAGQFLASWSGNHDE